MGIDILSQATSFETARDQEFVQIDEWLKESGALKERTTERGQIVTALKMVWWILCAPFRYPYLAAKKLFLCVLCFISRSFFRTVCAIRFVRDWMLDTLTMAKIVANRRVKLLGLAMLCLLISLIGLYGVVVWMGLVVAYVLCFIPTDARYYVRFFENLQRVWAEVLDDDDVINSDPQTILRVEKKKRTGFACKLAVRAISKVGMLSATKANALVYQKVILDEMRTLNVRYSDRVRILPLAIAACLDRPEEVRKVEECIRHYTSTSPAL
nr:MAG: hypothetical protein [Tombusviridae sp.]